MLMRQRQENRGLHSNAATSAGTVANEEGKT